MPIERINEMASKMAVGAWFAGLIYFRWFADDAPSVPYWAVAVLAVVGLFPVTVGIGGGMALAAAALNKLRYGHPEASPHPFSWAGTISAALTYWVAGWLLRAIAGWF